MANFERVLPGVGRQMVLLVAATLLLPLSSVVGRASMPQASQPQPSSCLGRWPRAVWGGLALRTESASAQSVLGVQSGAESSSGLMETAPFLRLRGGISKYYNHTASPNRGGIFEEPAAGVAEVYFDAGCVAEPIGLGCNPPVLGAGRRAVCVEQRRVDVGGKGSHALLSGAHDGTPPVYRNATGPHSFCQCPSPSCQPCPCCFSFSSTAF